MKRYSAYKPSGIEWIGDIPEKWDVVRIKFLCDTMYPGATPNTSVASFWDGNIPWIPSGCCHDCDINDAPKKITKAGLENSSTKIIPAATTLIALTGATCAQLGYLTIEACANQSVVAYVHNPHKAVAKYLFYALFAARQYILTHQSGGAQGGINLDDCKNFVIPRLPIDVQFSIAAYLDAKCAKIDNVLSVQQKRIELLKELKQSIITNAVTKGLDKNVEFKPSGIEWIGDIPEKWKIKRMRFLCKMNTGDKDTVNREDDGLYPFYVRSPNVERINSYTFDGEAVLMAGDGVGAGKVIHYANGKFDYHQRVYNFHEYKEILTKYAYYYLVSNFRYKIEEGGAKNTVDSVRLPWLKDFPICFPTIKEQEKILSYIERKSTAIDNQISKIERQIELLKEYKQSIITECVTGKRKVC